MDDIYIYWLAKEGFISKNTYDILVSVYGSLKNAHSSISAGNFIKINGLGIKTYERLNRISDLFELDKEFNSLFKQNIGFVSYFSKKYPNSLREISSPPIALFYKGSLPEDNEKLISIVGSRTASERGRYYAKKFSRELSENGIGVVSGLALGIDSQAHIGALAGRGKTYAVLGSGIDICYPALNEELYNEISLKGGIISEFPLGCRPNKNNFPRRNRLISGLSTGIFVIEAMEKSGSLITANFGLEQGKNIYSLPGESDNALSRGTNKLIQEGAKLVNDVTDILEDFELYSINGSHVSEQNLILESKDKIVYSTLCLEPKHISVIIEETGFSIGELFSILLKLELRGYVRRTSFDYYVLNYKYL